MKCKQSGLESLVGILRCRQVRVNDQAAPGIQPVSRLRVAQFAVAIAAIRPGKRDEAMGCALLPTVSRCHVPFRLVMHPGGLKIVPDVQARGRIPGADHRDRIAPSGQR